MLPASMAQKVTTVVFFFFLFLRPYTSAVALMCLITKFDGIFIFTGNFCVDSLEKRPLLMKE